MEWATNRYVNRITIPHPPEHKLRWYQYSLGTLLVLVTLFAIACSWYVDEAERIQGMIEDVKQNKKRGKKK